ncbi:MAG: hypothetical protein GY754_36830 [bacterium]|nr:hypothetical protein [bacterium]
MKMNVKSFALAFGAVYGVVIFTGTWWLIARGFPVSEPVLLGYFYPYYAVSPLGSVLGLVYGFVDGAIIGAIFAWFYNLLEGKKAQA